MTIKKVEKMVKLKMRNGMIIKMGLKECPKRNCCCNTVRDTSRIVREQVT